MKRLGQKILVLLLASPLVLFVLLQSRFFAQYWGSHRVPEKFVMADGYVGWIIVEYGNVSCPASVERDGFRVETVPADGVLCTSSPMPGGWADDVYEYAGAPRSNLLSNPQTGMNRIWHEHAESVGGAKRFYVFYVGDRLAEAELKRELKALHERLAGGGERADRRADRPR